MFGFLIGSTLAGILADKIGRKKTLIIGIVISSATILIQSFLKNFWAYAILRFITGVAAKSLFMIAFVISVEITSSKYSMELGILIQVSSF